MEMEAGAHPYAAHLYRLPNAWSGGTRTPQLPQGTGPQCSNPHLSSRSGQEQAWCEGLFLASAVGMEGGTTERPKIRESRGRPPTFSGNEQSVAQIIIKFVRAHLRDLAKNKRVFRYTLERDAKADVALLMRYKDILCESGAWFHVLAQNSGLKEGCLCIQFCVVVAPS